MERLKKFTYKKGVILREGKPLPLHRTGPYLAWTTAKKKFYAHQIVWFIHHGRIPKLIDHINGDKEDNRIENLRACTPAQNQYNSPKKRNNKSGFKGVVEHKRCTKKKWQAKIVVDGTLNSLGYYETPEKAGAVYEAAARKYAGEFAHPNPNVRRKQC